MKFWFIVILTLFIQETVTTSAVMDIAYHGHYNLYLFSLIFFIATISEIIVFYRIGKYLQIRNKNNKLVSLSKKYILKADSFIGAKGKKLFLILLSTSVFPPSLNAFMSSWLDMTLKEIFVCILFGNILWYILAWTVVLGVNYFVKDPEEALAIVLGITVILVIVHKNIGQKISGK